jgi:hypothetical protein
VDRDTPVSRTPTPLLFLTIILVCASMPCIECFLLFGVSCFSSVGSGVDVSNKFEITINNIRDHYLVINKQGKQPPSSEPMVSKYFKTYYFVTYSSTVFYQWIELSYLMHVPFLSLKYPDPLLLA